MFPNHAQQSCWLSEKQIALQLLSVVAAQFASLRAHSSAAHAGSAQAGPVRCFQARLFYSNRLHRPPHPIRVDSQMPQVRVLFFDFRFYFNLYHISIRIDTCWVWSRFNVSHMLHIHTHVRNTSNIKTMM